MKYYNINVVETQLHCYCYHTVNNGEKIQDNQKQLRATQIDKTVIKYCTDVINILYIILRMKYHP